MSAKRVRVFPGGAVQPGGAVRPGDTLLSTWSSVFPLSTKPAQRVQRLMGPTADVSDTAAVCQAYVKAINDCLPDYLRLRSDGNLFGVPHPTVDPGDALFASVINTDLEGIVRRCRTEA